MQAAAPSLKETGETMIYTFKVYALVTVFVFGLTSVFMFAVFAFREATDYARARVAMRHISSRAFREAVAISRTNSRSHERNSPRVA